MAPSNYPPPKVYHVSKQLHRVVFDLLRSEDTFLVEDGAVLCYTRNHALAAFLLAHGYTVQRTEKPTDLPRMVRLIGNELVFLHGDANERTLARVNASPDEPLGTEVVWVNPLYHFQEDE